MLEREGGEAEWGDWLRPATGGLICPRRGQTFVVNGGPEGGGEKLARSSHLGRADAAPHNPFITSNVVLENKMTG